jgi:hypothetical protein
MNYTNVAENSQSRIHLAIGSPATLSPGEPGVVDMGTGSTGDPQLWKLAAFQPNFVTRLDKSHRNSAPNLRF